MKPKLSVFNSTLSLRISLKVVISIAMLMMAALLVMSYHAHKAVRGEAIKKAEQTLDIVVGKTDNMLLCIEQTAGNIFYELYNRQTQPEEARFYCQEAVKANPYIEGCAIAFDPDFYKDGDGHSMFFFHKGGGAGQEAGAPAAVEVPPASLAPYMDQAWYTDAMRSGLPRWSGPFKDADGHGKSVVTFGLPLYVAGQRRPVGVFSVGVSLQTLSDVALQVKPSPNSYATLIDFDGHYIVHPDSDKLFHQDVFTQTRLRDTDPSVKEAALSMVAGERGYREFRMKGQDCYVFYRPFERISTPLRDTGNLRWSVGLVYPKQDIFDDLIVLQLSTLFTVLVVLMLVLLLCYAFLRSELLPLRLLTASAQHIAKGHLDETIPDSQQLDEVGQLQTHFQQMQRALSERTGNLEQLIAQLKEQGEHLAAAYEQAKEGDRMKTAFLHNMSDQMLPPVEAMAKDVAALCQGGDSLSAQEVDERVDNIQRQGKLVTKLLNDLLTTSL